MTSRWLTEVAENRGIDIRWRPFSLKLKNEERGFPEKSAAHGGCHPPGAAGDGGDPRGEGNGTMGPYYTELGRRIHHDGDNPLTDLEGAIAACGLDPGYIEAANNEKWNRRCGRRWPRRWVPPATTWARRS